MLSIGYFPWACLFGSSFFSFKCLCWRFQCFKAVGSFRMLEALQKREELRGSFLGSRSLSLDAHCFVWLVSIQRYFEIHSDVLSSETCFQFACGLFPGWRQ